MFPTDSTLSRASDAELFHRYQTVTDGESFRRLVERHLPLVWSTARRLVNGDAALAEDVTQIVFTDFAQKAPALPRGSIAAGWLHRHTCFTARKLVRTEVRRRTREHTAAQLQLVDSMNSEPDPTWLDAAPLVDAALDQLPRPDREALLLRFWQQQDHRSIGTALGSTEEAARKRIARALDKLRTLLRRRSVLLRAALLTQFLTDQATAAVPASFAATLPGAAWRQATTHGPITAVSGPLLRRCWPAAAAVVVVTGSLWTAALTGWFSSAVHSEAAALQAGSGFQRHADEKDIPLQFTLADVPAQSFGIRMLTYQTNGDDAALLEEITKLAGSGVSLREFDINSPSGRQGMAESLRPYHFSSQWAWDSHAGRGVALNTETIQIGTILKATPVTLPSGGIRLAWILDHHFAAPEFHAWPVSPIKTADAPHGAILMEDFHTSYSVGELADVKPGTTALLLSQHLTSVALPDSSPADRIILLFVTLASR